jgi:signal transduction histidine kinase
VHVRPEGELGGARADESLVRHILGNLVANAVKYSPAGTPVDLGVRRDGDSAVFRISDRGIGIPADELPQLFQAFSRASNVGDIPGSGLGLVIVKRCVDLHGGAITVESRPGEGSAFTVRLPAFGAPAWPASPDA